MNLNESMSVRIISATGTPRFAKGSINHRKANASSSGVVVVRQRLALWKTFHKKWALVLRIMKISYSICMITYLSGNNFASYELNDWNNYINATLVLSFTTPFDLLPYLLHRESHMLLYQPASKHVLIKWKAKGMPDRNKLTVKVKQAAVLATDKPFCVNCIGPSLKIRYE